ncbi:MAG: hypothetical protein ACYDAC_08625 [Candidatus Dormibacteria bacterium]
MRAASRTAALPRRVRHHYLEAFHDQPWRERLFLSSLGFDAGSVAARTITHLIRRNIGPFRNITPGGRHLHHLVFGISGLLGTGLLWLYIADSASQQRPIHALTSFTYGVASALTLDEFALWLDLDDVYWTKQGRISVEALMLFGGSLSIAVWGGPFLKRLLGEVSPPSTG